MGKHDDVRIYYDEGMLEINMTSISNCDDKRYRYEITETGEPVAYSCRLVASCDGYLVFSMCHRLSSSAIG